MHGLINRSIQNFVQDVYGEPVWAEVTAAAALEPRTFEAMLTYDDDVTSRVIDVTSARLKKPRSDFLEDLGTYLVSHPNMWRIRRLLRFGGADLEEFLESLGDLADRSRLAIPDLEVPAFKVETVDGTRYTLEWEATVDGFEHVLLGCLRGMADDYGALAMVECLDVSDRPGVRAVEIMLLSTSYAAGNSFMLAGDR